MDISTQVLKVISKIFQLCMITFLAVNLSNLIPAERHFGYINYFVLLLGAIYLYWDMVKEDFTDKTVDIRKTMALSILLCIVSDKPLYAYWCIFLVCYIALRSIHILSLLLSSFQNNERLNIEPSADNYAVPFLPCFTVGITTMCLLMHIGGETSFFQKFILMLDNQNIYNNDMFMLVSLIGMALIIELIGWLLNKKISCCDDAAGIGMGDVIALPCFAGFLGMPLFSTAFLLGLMTAIGIHIFAGIWRYKNCH